jgi:hypothetical protein
MSKTKQIRELITRLDTLEVEISKISKWVNGIKDQSLNLKLEIWEEKTKALRSSPVFGFQPGAIGSTFFERLCAGAGSPNMPTADICAEDGIEVEVTEVISLQIMGVIVAHKEAERMVICRELELLGVAGLFQK